MPIRLRKANPLFRCSRRDVLGAFRVVGREVRNKCRRYGKLGLTQQEAYELAGRVREQRELIRQLSDRGGFQHVRRLVRINTHLRRRVVDMVRRAGLDAQFLAFK